MILNVEHHHHRRHSPVFPLSSAGLGELVNLLELSPDCLDVLVKILHGSLPPPAEPGPLTWSRP